MKPFGEDVDGLSHFDADRYHLPSRSNLCGKTVSILIDAVNSHIDAPDDTAMRNGMEIMARMISGLINGLDKRQT